MYSTVQRITHEMSKQPFDQMRYRYKVTSWGEKNLSNELKVFTADASVYKRDVVELGILHPAT